MFAATHATMLKRRCDTKSAGYALIAAHFLLWYIILSVVWLYGHASLMIDQ